MRKRLRGGSVAFGAAMRHTEDSSIGLSNHHFEGGVMMKNDGKEHMNVNLSHEFHPYEDKTLNETQSEFPLQNEREPFNGYIKHQDIITGHHRNRTLSDYSIKSRRWVRSFAIVVLLTMLVGIVWSVANEIHVLHGMQ